MNHYPRSVLNLIDSFSKLPGIGKKTAERLAMHILKAPKKDAHELSKSITEARERTRLCTHCFSMSDDAVCNICNNPLRDKTLICVVESTADMIAIEKSGSFTGIYHILQGTLSPMDGVGPDDIRIPELFLRIEKEDIREVLIATGTGVEGESTASYIIRKLHTYDVKLTRIASGVPIGGDLKYIDQVTIKRAIESRRGITDI